MFGLFTAKREESHAGYGRHAPIARCQVFYRELLSQNSPAVFVEVQEDGRHLVYVSNRGVTPAYMNTPYDEWCRQQLVESYVFASLDTAQSYFQRRRGEDAPDLVSAVRSQMSFC
jgi:hypothetical protein